LKTNPGNARYRLNFSENRQILAETLLDLGEHTAAAAVTLELLNAQLDSPEHPYNAARCLVRCMVLVQKDAKLSAPQRSTLANDYGDRAVAAVRRAFEHGFEEIERLKKDKRPRPNQIS
jgi:hypothetical protein